MKKIILMLAIFLAAKEMRATASQTKFSINDTIPILRDTAVKDYVTMQGGKMLVVKNNKVGRMTTQMTMTDGSIVTPKGTVKTKDGHTVQLHEGDRVYMNGMIEGPEKTPI